ncbi:MAG: hypothetical protein BWX44_00010 [Spirochaetes bacterium ADurb.Bin001]|nr:MAG: hypothetical protein BWX44_00010 [Spirochaetes bacterium ADurb.Bin001]
MIMTITTTQRHTPAESVNERTSGRRIDAVQQFVSFRITETGNTDEAGKFTLTHTPIGSLSRQSDTLSRINREPDLVALTADDQTLYTGEFDQDNKTIELYTDAAKTTPAENLVGVKVSYWYYAPIKGTLNDDGTFTPEAIITPVDSDGNEKFTDANPGAVQLTGSLPAGTNRIGSVELSGSAAIVLAKGITTQDGAPVVFVDDGKNFDDGVFVGKTAKLTINNIEYYREIISNTGPGIGITPIQVELPASATLTGTATPPNGQITLLYVSLGEEGNAATIHLVDNVSGEINQPMSGTLSLEDGVHLVITSATQGVAPGASLGFTATDVANYISNDPDVLGLAQYFSVAVDAIGQLDAPVQPAQFSGGQNAIIVPEGTLYEILDYGISSVQLVGNSIPSNQSVPVQLTGSIPEYAWFSDDVTKPTPTEDFAWGNEFNKVTGELKVYGWTGTVWMEVV